MSLQMSNLENLRLSLESISANKLRTFLTALIIAIGITALVGILTSIDAIQNSLTDSFSAMGANSFNIRNRGINVQIGGSGKRPKVFKKISYQEALRFKNGFSYPATVSVSAYVSNGAIVRFGSNETNPNISVLAGDENYLPTAGYKLSLGRNITKPEAESGSSLVIIGSDIKDKLFKQQDPINQYITIGHTRFKVIGCLESKGSSAGMGADRMCIVPLERGRAMVQGNTPSYTITVSSSSPDRMEGAIGEAKAAFRNIRKLGVQEESNFEITKSDAVAQVLMSSLTYVTLGAVVIGLITLVGASVGLMNIMLVSVTERTREIGVRKAIGATPKIIRTQFLTESIVICLLGGLGGILLGMLLGNIVALALGTKFIVPWAWIFLGIAVCVGVGMISGFYPASKAAKLDPIESLRYE
ncbi:ABC transporter permease [Olivibacter sitiensis]|uniref:ABC transporter permease n=1 Tax=Olivibacter sitiensis TaxID=376470 RepID=UPI000413919D|nr:ABC transporter permease [Olivibacter sitiensis]